MAVEALTAVLSERDPDVLWKAADALRRIGQGQGETITALRALLDRREQRVRFAADFALSEITGVEDPR